ncbi:uncharacterized protein EURHEDRAFT_402866 [Aspergillus ruber CBS 135680]|uniref:Uncharacterized protein n=1 Tax=Aspergillus ruber (strain CBS 135680) TaxID=1388766 RepID=A0A017SEM8_ASPRC|nr:uncharacterized protein EURHEDRAFT_402866 [Aspergillus ruber CBS 135680]EYE95236.1 hypothetical protein EURHEDRAFT_402866 [Aspergillus ruber CBS 135680]
MSFFLPFRSKHTTSPLNPAPQSPSTPTPDQDSDKEYEHILAQLSAPDWSDSPHALGWFHDLRTSVLDILTRLLRICQQAIKQYETSNTTYNLRYNNRYNRLTTSVVFLRSWLNKEFLPEMRMTKWFLRAVDDVFMVRATEVQYDIEYWMGGLRREAERVVGEGHALAGLVQDAIIKLGEIREGIDAAPGEKVGEKLRAEEMFLDLPLTEKGAEVQKSPEEAMEIKDETETVTEAGDDNPVQSFVA